MAQNVPVEEVYRSWVNVINASGGINGHPIDLIAKDDSGNPGTAVSSAQSLIADHVDAIVDNSVVDTTFASAVQAANIPVVGLLTNGVTFTKYPDFYPEAQTNDSVLYAVAATAKLAGAKSLGNIYCAEAAQCAQTVPLLEAAGKQLGIPVQYNAEISATAPNYTAQCLAAKQQHIGALALIEATTINIHIASDCANQGYNPVYVVEGPGFGLNMASATGLRNSTWIESSGVPFFANTPAVNAMNSAVDRYYPGVRQNQNLWFENDALAWSSGILLEDAIKAGGLASRGTPTAAEVVKGLSSLHGDTLQGMAPPLTFTPGKVHAVDCWFTARVVNGVPTVVNGGQVTCEK